MSYRFDYAHLPPPDPPELPAGVRRQPAWPWWFGLAGFGAAVVSVLVVGGTLFAIAAGVTGQNLSDPSPGLNIFGTVVQDALLVAVALGMAAFVARPRGWQFGLRPTRFWPAVGWSALTYLVYIIFVVIYAGIIGSDQEQTTLEDLGAEDSRLSLILVGVMVVGVAPVVEEFFFRGFLYTALRRRLPVVLAALFVGVLFGAVHVPTGAEAAAPLAFLGFVLCLLYERTGSLYPCIALHALQNMLAYTFGADAPEVAIPTGIAVIAGCILIPASERKGSGVTTATAP